MQRDHLARLILDTSTALPDAVAVTELDRHGAIRARRTYAQLAERCSRISASLATIGGDAPVVLLSLEGVAFAEAFFSCTFAGRVAIPLRAPRHLRDNAGLSLLRGAVDDASASVVF